MARPYTGILPRPAGSNHRVLHPEYYIEKHEHFLSLSREYSKNALIEHRQFVNDLKAGKSCVDCGQTYPSYVMEYHHLADKKFTISKAANRSREDVLAEIAKCILLCANCHAIRTHG